MCDISIAMGDVTRSGRVVFGKNSDRPAGECQVLHDSGLDAPSPKNRIRCAFVDLPDTETPLRTIGCRPYWCWGYETGFNEAGVVGGNTAVYTRAFWQSENQRNEGLSGMELLRLGLARGRSAQEAVSTIVEFLERYGQWGPAVINTPPPQGCYENAFLIADAREAWVLETAGKRWVSERVTEGSRALSNQLSIRERWSDASGDLAAYAAAQGWWSAGNRPFDFARAYSDHEHYARQVSHIRWSRARRRLQDVEGRIDVVEMMSLLRDHYESTFLGGPQFDAFQPDFLSICMHESPAGFTWGNTATSVVVEIDPDDPGATPFWFSYQPPCSSVYSAVFLGVEIPAAVTRTGTAGLLSGSPLAAPADAFHGDSLWWRLYRVLHAIGQDPAVRAPAARRVFDGVEKENHRRIGKLDLTPDAGRSSRLHRAVNDEILGVQKAVSSLEADWDLT